MRLTLRDQRGLWAALAAVVFLSFGCSTAQPRVESTGTLPSHGGNLELTPDQEAHAAALAHYATALSFTATDSITAALPEYRASLNLDPSNLSLALWLAEIYRSRRDMTNALAVLEASVKANADSAEPWVARGLVYRSNEDFVEAIAAFKQALKLEPTHYGATRALVETYLAQNETNNVVALLDKSFHQPSKEANYWIVLGDLFNQAVRQTPSLASRLDHARTRQCYERAAALAPQDPDILARLGDAYMNENDFAAAATEYAKLIELRPNIPQFRERLAAIYLRTEQKEKAVALYKEFIKRDPGRFEFYNVLAELSEELDHPEDALSYYEQSLTLNTDQPDNYFAIAQLQHQLKRPDDAIKTMETWKRKFPLDWRVPYLYAFTHTEQKEFAKAVADYADAETLAREAPQEVSLKAEFYFNYGAACERANDLQKADLLFRKAIKLNPQYANALNYLGYMWAEKNTNLTESLELIQKAVDLEPDNGAYLDSLGWVLYKSGRTAEALPRLRRAIELLEKDDKRAKAERQDDAVVYDHLAEVLLKSGKPTEAVQAWKRALEVDPGNKEITEKLQKHNADHTGAH